MQEKINQEEQKPSPPILTPKKQVQGNQRQYQAKRYCKFKGIQPQNLYIPKLRVNSLKSSELSLAYVYKINSLEHIGSVQQWSDGKHKSNSEQKNSNQMISQVKRKGIRDYTMFIKRSQQERDSQLSSIFIVGTSTFKSDKILNYFQIKLLEISEDSLACFSFGVTNSQQSLASSKNSISLSCKLTSQRTLQIYRNNNKMQQINDFRIKLQDTIGCGFIYHRNQIFITHNKHIILERLKLYIPQSHEDRQNKQPKPIKQFMQVHNHRYYPFIQLQSKKISIQVIFQNSHQCFKFPYLEQVNNLKSRLMDEETVKSADMSDESIYGLVLSYFKFNGYDKTSQLDFQAEMMKRDMKFYPQNYPIRNKLQYGKRQQSQVLDETRKIFQLGKQKKIRKKTRKNHSERLRRSLEQDLLLQVPQMIDQVSHRGSDQDSQQNKERSQSDQYQQNYCKSSSHSRNKKKVLEHTEQLVDKQKIQLQQRRKQEVNSYLNKKIQKKFEEMKRTSQQKYKTQRIQIMKNIQDGKIDQALKLFSKAYKIILSKYKYLQVFFKAHLFLKYYNQQGLQRALQFAKKQHKSFTQYQNYLMPFFNNKSLKNQGQNQYEYRPLREILFLICPEKKEQFNIQRQFYVFSQFISQVICQYSGFHGMSKLELVLNSYRVVEKKISQLEIPIGGFDLQSMGLI